MPGGEYRRTDETQPSQEKRILWVFCVKGRWTLRYTVSALWELMKSGRAEAKALYQQGQARREQGQGHQARHRLQGKKPPFSVSVCAEICQRVPLPEPELSLSSGCAEGVICCCAEHGCGLQTGMRRTIKLVLPLLFRSLEMTLELLG